MRLNTPGNTALDLPSLALRGPVRMLRALQQFERDSGGLFRSRVAKTYRRMVPGVAFFALASASARAQSPQLLPEIDTYLKINPSMRAYFQAEGDRDGGAPIQATIGPSIQFYLKPLLKLQKVTCL